MTPDNWFDLTRLAAVADTGTTLDFTLTAADGRQPLADVSLAELRAVHQTFGAWWPLLGADRRTRRTPGAYDRFLADSRALLRQRAEAALASPDAEGAAAPALLGFPDPGHPLARGIAGGPGVSQELPGAAPLARRSWRGRAGWPRPMTRARGQRSREWLRLRVAESGGRHRGRRGDRLPAAGLRGWRRRPACTCWPTEAGVLERCGLAQHAVLGAGARPAPGRARTELGVRAGAVGPRPGPPRRHHGAGAGVLPRTLHRGGHRKRAGADLLGIPHSRGRRWSPDGTVERASRIDDPRLAVRVNPRIWAWATASRRPRPRSTRRMWRCSTPTTCSIPTGSTVSRCVLEARPRHRSWPPA